MIRLPPDIDDSYLELQEWQRVDKPAGVKLFHSHPLHITLGVISVCVFLWLAIGYLVRGVTG